MAVHSTSARTTHSSCAMVYSGQVHMARLHNVEMQPYLHYRFLLLETRRVTDFESLDSFDAWFDRQAKVAHR